MKGNGATMTKFENYALVMVANGMHFAGSLLDAQSAAFGRIEMSDAMMVIVNQKGEMGLNEYMFACKKITLYPVLIIRFEDLEERLYKGLTGAFIQKHSRIQLVSK